MTTVNQGPAQTLTPNSVAVVTPVNTQQNSNPQGGNALRLIAVARGISLSNTGDTAVMPVLNSSSFVATTVVTTNALVNGVSGTIAAAALGVFTAAAAGGTAVKSNGVLTGQTTNAFAFVQTATSAAASVQANNLFVNVGTAVAGGTCDLFVYGYDVS